MPLVLPLPHGYTAPSGDFTFDDNFTHSGAAVGILLHTPDPGPGVWAQKGTVGHSDGIQVHGPPGDARCRRNSTNYYHPNDLDTATREARHWIKMFYDDRNENMGMLLRWADEDNHIDVMYTGIDTVRVRQWVGGAIDDLATRGGFSGAGVEIGCAVDGSNIQLYEDNVAVGLPITCVAALLSNDRYGIRSGPTRSDSNPFIDYFYSGYGAWP